LGIEKEAAREEARTKKWEGRELSAIDKTLEIEVGARYLE
jgi:hypothetical protein